MLDEAGLPSARSMAPADAVAEAVVRPVKKNRAELVVMPGPGRLLRALMDYFSQTDLRAVADELRAAGGTVSVLIADLTQPGAPAALVDAVDREHGGIDLLVNNASSWARSGAPAPRRSRLERCNRYAEPW